MDILEPANNPYELTSEYEHVVKSRSRDGKERQRKTTYQMDKQTNAILETKAPYKITKRYGVREYAQGILLSDVTIKVHFRSDDEVNSIKIVLVRNATFNDPLPELAFQMRVPPETTILDYRDGKDRPKRSRKLGFRVDDPVFMLDAKVKKIKPGVTLIESASGN